MKRYKLIVILLLLNTLLLSQTKISIEADTTKIERVDFYIEKVVDSRKNKDNIGKIYHDSSKQSHTTYDLEKGVEKALKNYFDIKFPENKKSLQKILISVKTFKISGIEGKKRVSIIFDFYESLDDEQQSLFAVKSTITEVNNDNIESLIKVAINDCLVKFIYAKKSETAQNYNDYNFEETENDSSFSNNDNSTKSSNKSNKNILAIGYQIGGFTLVGLDYEVRIHDYYGIHFGLGLRGFTVGIKVHFSKKMNSGFLNFSYKDGGFGLVSTANAEFGGRFPFSKKHTVGLHYQVGFGKILSIDPTFEKMLFQGNKAPTITLVLGVGLSW